MEIHEFYIPSSSGIANLHCMEWIPSGEVKAIVQIAHGMMEHVGRYREFAEFLAGHGIYVLGNDHLGHGKTAAAAEDRGYFGEHGGAVSVIRDMRRVTVHAQRKYPGVPIFLLGHSMGSFFARRYLTVYKDGIRRSDLTRDRSSEGRGGPAWLSAGGHDLQTERNTLPEQTAL